jgi:glycosyltransferase involved in cell wall biosynthesis
LKSSVFIVAYYWPPAGGPGVQRWLKFAKYLVQSGIDTTVVVPENPDYPVTDHSLLNEIPKPVKVIKVPINEPSRKIKKLAGSDTDRLQKGIISKKPGLLEKLLLWVRGNYFIPDARKSWASRVVAALEQDPIFLTCNNLITTGPPHSVHLIGLQLKKKQLLKDINWIADFRDPWTTIGYHKKLKLSRSSARKHIELEKRVLQNADKIIVTSPTTRAEFEAKTSIPVQIITNGFDIQPNSTAQPETRFTVSHIGTLLEDRNPLALWDALAQLVEEHDEFAQDFQLQLAGNVSSHVVDSIKECGLAEHLDVIGYVDHRTATRLMYDSQLLLLIEIDSPNTTAIIPGKLFEYLASRRPIIAVGPEGSDIRSILESTKAGKYYTYQVNELKQDVLKHYKLYKSGKLLGNSNNIEQFSREALTDQLIEILAV